jgi:hypothetical protein
MSFEQSYPLLQSTLVGVFSIEVSLSDEEAARRLRSNLDDHPGFREGIAKELKAAFAAKNIHWAEVLAALEIGDFESDDAAREFVRENVFDAVLLASK